MGRIPELNSVWIKKAFNCFGKCDFVFFEIQLFFFQIPFEFHKLIYHINMY